MRNVALPFDVPVKERIHHNRSASVGEQLTAQADQSTAGHAKFDAHAAVSVIVHVQHFAFADTQLFHHYANEFFRHVYGQFLDWFHQFSIHPLGNDLGLSHHEFETFAAHHLDENRKLQFASSHHRE